MRRITLRFLVASITFLFGLTATLFWIEYRRPIVGNLDTPPCFRPPYYESTLVPCSGADFSALGNLPTLEYCDLVSNDEFYNGQIVRVRAGYGGNKHGVMFYDESCSKGTQISVYPNLTTIEEVEKTLNQVRDPSIYWEPLELIAIGRFKKVAPSSPEYNAATDIPSLQFEMMRVEKAFRVR